MKDTYKCNYKYCRQGGTVDKKTAVKDGNRYYHEDCLYEKRDKQKISDIYYKCYKSSEPIQLVSKTINVIINDKGIASEYVLYVICQAVRNKTQMRNINSLHYLITNNDTKEDYKKKKAIQIVKNISYDNTVIVKHTTMDYKKKKKQNWSETLF